MTQGQTGEQTCACGKHYVLALRNKVQLQLSFQIKFRSVSEILTTAISYLFVETLWSAVVDLCQVAVYPTLIHLFVYTA